MKRFLLWILLTALLIPAGLCETQCDIPAAIEALKACWREEYAASESAPGYLEIKNTRIIAIAEAPKAAQESMQPQADEIFGNVSCIVEFMLYSNLAGLAPYYQAPGIWECVMVHKDGTMAVPLNNPFDAYRARTYSMDLSGIIADVTDLKQEYNAVYHLLEE